MARWGYCYDFKEMMRRRQETEPFGHWAVVRGGWVSPQNYPAFIEKLRREHAQREAAVLNPGVERSAPERQRLPQQLRTIRESGQADGGSPRRIYMATDRIDDAGKWCRFEYVDADGIITDRHVVNWERRGRYLVGFDKDRRAVRTFRFDRISEWMAG